MADLSTQLQTLLTDQEGLAALMEEWQYYATIPVTIYRKQHGKVIEITPIVIDLAPPPPVPAPAPPIVGPPAPTPPPPPSATHLGASFVAGVLVAVATMLGLTKTPAVPVPPTEQKIPADSPKTQAGTTSSIQMERSLWATIPPIRVDRPIPPPGPQTPRNTRVETVTEIAPGQTMTGPGVFRVKVP